MSINWKRRCTRVQHNIIIYLYAFTSPYTSYNNNNNNIFILTFCRHPPRSHTARQRRPTLTRICFHFGRPFIITTRRPTTVVWFKPTLKILNIGKKKNVTPIILLSQKAEFYTLKVVGNNLRQIYEQTNLFFTIK